MALSATESLEEIMDVTAQIKAHPETFYGPWLLSLLALTFMMGILATQATRYFSTFGYESPRLFYLVVSCIILVVAEWIALLIIEWNMCITNFGDWSCCQPFPGGFTANFDTVDYRMAYCICRPALLRVAMLHPIRS